MRRAAQRFAMTDLQWTGVCGSLRPVTLPKEARERIDQCVHLFRLMKAYDEADRNSPALLKRTAAAATKLTAVLKRIGERERFAVACSVLLDAELPEEPTEYREAHVDGVIRGAIDQLMVVSEYCEDGSEVDFSKRRNHTGGIDRLLISLDLVLQQFTSLRVARTKAAFDFVKKVCTLADDQLGSGSIERSIVRLQRCGRFPKKQSAKATAQITRKNPTIRVHPFGAPRRGAS